MSQNLELKFHGPFHITNGQKENLLLSPLGELKGVYVWVIPFRNKYLSYYVVKQANHLFTALWNTSSVI